MAEEELIRNPDSIVDLINVVIIVQGEVQKIFVWAKRLEADLDRLMRELIARRDKGE